MKRLLLVALLAAMLQGCTSETPAQPQPAEPAQPPAAVEPAQQPATELPATEQPQESAKNDPQEEEKGFENEIFQGVTVTKDKEKADTYIIKGKARVFEGGFSYTVEDGHNELTKGSVQAAAGAPEWGDFQFSVTVKKNIPNSTLILILYEASPKDGSRKGELPIALPAS